MADGSHMLVGATFRSLQLAVVCADTLNRDLDECTLQAISDRLAWSSSSVFASAWP